MEDILTVMQSSKLMQKQDGISSSNSSSLSVWIPASGLVTDPARPQQAAVLVIQKGPSEGS